MKINLCAHRATLTTASIQFIVHYYFRNLSFFTFEISRVHWTIFYALMHATTEHFNKNHADCECVCVRGKEKCEKDFVRRNFSVRRFLMCHAIASYSVDVSRVEIDMQPLTVHVSHLLIHTRAWEMQWLWYAA